jgi:hypothetical protein
LNNALVDFILTGYGGFSTAAGHIGPDVRVDHDISLLIPEVWARLTTDERDPAFLIANGYLEPLSDFVRDGKPILASRLGYRITAKFMHDYFGRVFDSPSRVFDEGILHPEKQDPEMYDDGIQNIVEAQQRVARTYFEDGSIDECCPPLRALLKEMAAEPSVDPGSARSLRLNEFFSRERLLESDWYQQRLLTKQQRDTVLWKRHVKSLERFLARKSHTDVAQSMEIESRLRAAREMLDAVSSEQYIDRLRGTIGADPLGPIESAVESDARLSAVTS